MIACFLFLQSYEIFRSLFVGSGACGRYTGIAAVPSILNPSLQQCEHGCYAQFLNADVSAYTLRPSSLGSP